LAIRPVGQSVMQSPIPVALVHTYLCTSRVVHWFSDIANFLVCQQKSCPAVIAEIDRQVEWHLNLKKKRCVSSEINFARRSCQHDLSYELNIHTHNLCQYIHNYLTHITIIPNYFHLSLLQVIK
jgi:hypothetical protein